MHPAKSTISGMLTWPSTIEHVALGLSFMVAAGSGVRDVVHCYFYKDTKESFP